jgi:hypothetical protein
MPVWLEVVLEILKITLPVLVALGAVYFIIREYLQNEYRMRALELRQRDQSNTLSLRLQAYERMVLFCERAYPPQLALRLRTEAMNAGELKAAMVMAVQQEFEHNFTQQLYVSRELWQILELAKNEVSAFISLVGKQVPGNEPSLRLAEAIFAQIDEQGGIPILEKAKDAIRQEAALPLGR